MARVMFRHEPHYQGEAASECKILTEEAYSDLEIRSGLNDLICVLEVIDAISKQLLISVVVAQLGVTVKTVDFQKLCHLSFKIGSSFSGGDQVLDFA